MVRSGMEPTGGSSSPVAMAEVVRAALARIDDDLVHVLVDVGVVTGWDVVARAADDIAELLAELIANAVAACAPAARVRVSGQAVADRYVIEVQDRGVGASSDEPALRRVPLVESVPRRLFALFERMAASHGISVRLCRSSHGGVNALVALPRALSARRATPPRAARPPGEPSPGSDRDGGPQDAGAGAGAGMLPRRRPMSSLHAELRRPAAAWEPPVRRSPDQVRSFLSTYDDGLRRGRDDAGAAAVQRLRGLVAPTTAGTPA
jgi:hypothetical protein